MDQLMHPNIAGNFQQGYAFGNQVKQQRKVEQDQNMLRGLAPQIIAGDAGAYDQAAAISPEAANAYQGAGDNQLRRLKGFINYVDQARASNNPAAVNAALQAGSGFVGRFIGKPGPTEWTPDMEPGWEQLKAKVAMMESGGTQGRVQSTYVDGDGNRVAIMADGTQKILGANDSGMSQQTISIPGSDGRPRQFTFDKRTGNYVPAGEGGSSSALGAPPAAPGTGGNPLPQGGTAQIVDAIAEQANRMIASGIPADQVDAWAQSQAGAQPPGGNGFQNTQPIAAGASPFVGRSPEEQAALTTAAQEQAKITAANANFPTQLAQDTATTQMKTQAEIEAAQGKNVAEKAGKIPQINSVIRGLDRIDAAVNALDGAFVDTGPIDQYMVKFTPAGQELDAAVGAIQNDMLALTRVPGVGSQSDMEARIANLKWPSLSNPPEVNRRNIAALRAFMSDLQQSAGLSNGSAVVESDGVDDLLSKYGAQ